MVKKLIVLAAALMFLGPTLGLVGVALIANPAANASCTTTGSTSVTVGNIPNSLEVTTANGETLTLNRQQLTHAATILTEGAKIDGVTRDGLQIALMAALTESGMRMLANTGTYPESGDYPHDGNGSDHDSLGLFQMRPQSGWGTVEQLMDPTYQAAAFFGGPEGPNYPSPRGLLDIPGWQQMSKGEAAQAVEVSAYPDRYDNYAPAAEKILTTLTTDGTGNGTSGVMPVAESSRVVFPLPEGTWVQTSSFGPRTDPINGASRIHSGLDLAAPDGTAIMAAADGTVTQAHYTETGGGIIVIEHHIDSKLVATAYIHMWETGIHVTEGQSVTAGQHIGDVGSSGHSTGPHLHFEVRPGGTNSEAIDPAPWLNTHNAADLPEATGGTDADGCSASTTAGDPAAFPGGDPDQMVDDPTTGGQITARMSYVMAQTRQTFPDTSWSCYSPRTGTQSEHPLGRACDITFGNPIGTRPTPSQLEAGWEVTNWVKDHAETLGVHYLIWQGTIWNIDRDAEGWRPYNGGGMHDPTDITGGHYDHLHITVKEGGL